MSYEKVEIDYELDVDLGSLLQMIIYRRSARSEGELEFIHNYIDTIDGIDSDDHGNRIIRVGDGTSPVLWSSHTDTVHRNERAGKYQKISFKNGIIATNDPASTCLGADCTAGVWIMKEMIRAGVEGLYVFHRDEEVGGFGSSYIAKETPELLEGIKFAIAFDRKGNDSVITHQFSQRCASKAFVDSILPMLPPGYCADSGGTFTDTANYTDIVMECTNLSVGYENAHMSNEYLNVRDLIYLRNAIITKFDHTKLVAERDVTATEYDKSYGSFGGFSNRNSSGMEKQYSGPGWDWDDDDEEDDIPFVSQGNNVISSKLWSNKPTNSNKKFFDIKDYLSDQDGDEVVYNHNNDCRSLLEFIRKYPNEAADYFENQGYCVDDLYASAPWLDENS